MDSFSLWHLIFVLVVLAVVVVPFWKIFPRAGWSPWLALLMVISPLNLVLLWFLAFKRWPGDR